MGPRLLDPVKELPQLNRKKKLVGNLEKNGLMLSKKIRVGFVFVEIRSCICLSKKFRFRFDTVDKNRANGFTLFEKLRYGFDTVRTN